MPCVAVNRSATLLFMGAASRVCAVVWFLSWRYSTTYGLPLTCLSYVAQLNSGVVYGTQDEHNE